MKTRKQMRNIFMKKIDDILIRYYKEMDFNLLASDSAKACLEETAGSGEAYRKEAMDLIELMKELELLNAGEYILLRDVYSEYFGIHRC